MDGHSTTSSHLYVEPLLKEKAKSLLVVSPYIGQGYADMLVELGRKKRVRIITSGSAAWLKDYAERYSRQLLFRYIKALVAIVIVCLALLYLRLSTFAAFGFLVFICVFGVGYLKFRGLKSSDIEVKVVRNTFIHEKMYISDGQAVVGSANLTYPGMHKNLEHVEVFTEKEKISEFRRHFDDIWKRS